MNEFETLSPYWDRLKKEKDEPEFDINERGFNVKCWHLVDDESLNIKADALVELRYDDKVVRRLLFPSYKIWNIAAHFSDIVDGELDKDDQARGYRIAGSDGLGGCIMPIEITEDK